MGKRASQRVYGSLSRKKELALAALLTKTTLKEAAADVGVTDRVLRGWLKDADFLNEYRQLRSQVLEQGVALLARGVTLAAAELIKTLTSQTATTSQKIFAARTIIEYGLRGDRAMRIVNFGMAPDRIKSLDESLREYAESIGLADNGEIVRDVPPDTTNAANAIVAYVAPDHANGHHYNGNGNGHATNGDGGNGTT